MANAYKCDRCKEFFDDIGISYGCILGDRSLIAKTLREYWYPDSVDLCPKCANKLREILKVWWKEDI